MGHYYGFKPSEMRPLTMQQLGMYLRNIPDMQKRVEAGNATLAWLTAAVHSNKTEYEQWYSPYARTGEVITYVADTVLDIRTALRKYLMTQAILDLLGNSQVGHSLKAIQDR